jgi:hypothetical protein
VLPKSKTFNQWPLLTNNTAHVTLVTRNLILDHSSSDRFQYNYLGKLAPLDIWGILRGQEPQNALVKQSFNFGAFQEQTKANQAKNRAVCIDFY